MNSTVAGEPIFDAIVRFNADRDDDLVRLKLKRLDESVFCFFRGTDELFGEAWNELRPRDPGPAILCSGDLHLENFGACQSQEGDFRFEINDFDEAVVAPCSFDLVRCTASILLAGEDWGLSPLDATGIALAFLDQYRHAVIDAVDSGTVGEISPRSGEGPLWDLLNVTSQGAKPGFLDHETRRKKNGTREIIRSAKKHPDVGPKRRQRIQEAIEDHGKAIGKAGAYKVLDVTARIAGIGSLGLRRYTVLIEGGGSPDRNRLLDVKEARRSVVADHIEIPQPAFPTEAERVVEAQRQLQSRQALGLGTVQIGEQSYRLREMIPDENRSSLDRLQRKPKKLKRAVEVVGQLVGWSQVRGANRPAGAGSDERQALAEWAKGPGIDAVLAAAVRVADHTQSEYDEYHRAYSQ
ncbi:MAG: DUF2252 family protein [Planctomycetia bacterium]|nr:DUF2252 family protein [Planctomycetia bacterium]